MTLSEITGPAKAPCRPGCPHCATGMDLLKIPVDEAGLDQCRALLMAAIGEPSVDRFSELHHHDRILKKMIDMDRLSWLFCKVRRESGEEFQVKDVVTSVCRANNGGISFHASNRLLELAAAVGTREA